MLKFDTSRKRFFGFIFLGWILLIISDRIGELRQYQGAFVAMYALAIASIILLTGYSGQLSLGHSALMAVGAYAGALSINNLKLHPAIALIIAALVALAGTTLALAVSLPTIANQFPILGGEQGLVFDIGIPPARLGEDFSLYQWFFWISSLSAIIMIWLLVNLISTRYGREFRALRDNPIAAQLCGINIGRKKAVAFSLSAGIAGLAGGLLVMLISGVSPSAFPLSLSFLLLAGAVVTGVYSLKGVILGALVLVAIPEIAESVVSRIGGSEGFITSLPGFMVSALLILTVLFAPSGPGHLLHHKKHLKH